MGDVEGMYLPTSKVYVPKVRAHLVDMPDEMWQQIGVAAKATKVSRAAWIREVIAAGLNADGIRPATDSTPAEPSTRPGVSWPSHEFVPQKRNALRCETCGVNKARHGRAS
jgi:hypothetical protein